MEMTQTKILLASGLRDLICYELKSKSINNGYFFYDAYQNGREQGFTISCTTSRTRLVTISEQKNSDQIVVYLENTAFQGLDEASYAHAMYFNFGQYSEVVKFCVNYLIGN